MSWRLRQSASRVRRMGEWLLRECCRVCFRIGPRTLDSKLAELIGQRREWIFMHSSLSRCGYVAGGERMVIEGVARWCEVLCLPTHTYCYPKGSPPLTPMFDPRFTDSVVGEITNYFRRLPGVVRSIHPTHSLAARGPGAAELVAGHERCDTPCGRGTPYAKLIHGDAAVLMFGATMNTYTLFHTAEDEAGCDYLYFPEPCRLKALDYDNQLHEVQMWRQDMTVPRRFTEMDAVLQREGLLRAARLRRGTLLFIPSARETHAFLMEQLSRDPHYLVAAPHRPPGDTSCK